MFRCSLIFDLFAKTFLHLANLGLDISIDCMWENFFSQSTHWFTPSFNNQSAQQTLENEEKITLHLL